MKKFKIAFKAAFTACLLTLALVVGSGAVFDEAVGPPEEYAIAYVTNCSLDIDMDDYPTPTEEIYSKKTWEGIVRFMIENTSQATGCRYFWVDEQNEPGTYRVSDEFSYNVIHWNDAGLEALRGAKMVIFAPFYNPFLKDNYFDYEKTIQEIMTYYSFETVICDGKVIRRDSVSYLNLLGDSAFMAGYAYTLKGFDNMVIIADQAHIYNLRNFLIGASAAAEEMGYYYYEYYHGEIFAYVIPDEYEEFSEIENDFTSRLENVFPNGMGDFYVQTLSEKQIVLDAACDLLDRLGESYADRLGTFEIYDLGIYGDRPRGADVFTTVYDTSLFYYENLLDIISINCSLDKAAYIQHFKEYCYNFHNQGFSFWPEEIILTIEGNVNEIDFEQGNVHTVPWPYRFEYSFVLGIANLDISFPYMDLTNFEECNNFVGFSIMENLLNCGIFPWKAFQNYEINIEVHCNGEFFS